MIGRTIRLWTQVPQTMSHIWLLSLITEPKDIHEPPITIPNGERVEIEGRGDYILKNGTKRRGVLHVPKLNRNLLFVNKVSKDLQCVVTFFPNFFVMQGLTSRTLIGAGKSKDGLYQIWIVEDKRQAMMATIDIWHNHLGHA